MNSDPGLPAKAEGAGTARRGYGSGSLYQQAGNWYGRWHVDGKRVKRKLGPVRPAGTREGLTRAQAERELRRTMSAHEVLPAVAERVTVTQAGERLIRHPEGLGRRPTTLAAYRAALRSHLTPALGELPLGKVAPRDVEGFIAAERRRGVAPKTTLNALGFLHSIFELGMRRGWCRQNPCKLVDKPRVEPSPDIRFLDQEELEALLRATAQSTDRTLFLAAALTGMRQGELLALRWRDTDWSARRVRVRRNYVRGNWGAPKTRRGSRAVPLADRLASELEHHFRRSLYTADDDLVFCHPALGSVLDHSDLVRRF
jgi:integrase